MLEIDWWASDKEKISVEMSQFSFFLCVSLSLVLNPAVHWTCWHCDKNNFMIFHTFLIWGLSYISRWESQKMKSSEFTCVWNFILNPWKIRSFHFYLTFYYYSKTKKRSKQGNNLMKNEREKIIFCFFLKIEKKRKTFRWRIWMKANRLKKQREECSARWVIESWC